MVGPAAAALCIQKSTRPGNPSRDPSNNKTLNFGPRDCIVGTHADVNRRRAKMAPEGRFRDLPHYIPSVWEEGAHVTVLMNDGVATPRATTLWTTRSRSLSPSLILSQIRRKPQDSNLG